MFAKTMNTKNIVVTEINILDRSINLKGTFVDSAYLFNGYKTRYKDRILYIKIKGSLFSFTKSSSDFNININNSFGDLEKIYLEDSDQSKNILLWSKK